MKKLYNFRIETNLIKQIDKIPGTRTQKITDAIQTYLQPDLQTPGENIYNVNLVRILQEQIQDLKEDKSILQRRLDYFMLPWYRRMLLPSKKN